MYQTNDSTIWRRGSGSSSRGIMLAIAEEARESISRSTSTPIMPEGHKPFVNIAPAMVVGPRQVDVVVQNGEGAGGEPERASQADQSNSAPEVEHGLQVARDQVLRNRNDLGDEPNRLRECLLTAEIQNVGCYGDQDEQQGKE